MPDPLALSRYVRSALMDARPIEIQLVDAAGLQDIEEVAGLLAKRVRDLYISLGGQDIEATVEERGGTLVIRLRPRDDPPDE